MKWCLKLLLACMFSLVASYTLGDPGIWVAKINGDPQEVHRIAQKYGYLIIDEWPLMKNTYILKQYPNYTVINQTDENFQHDIDVEWLEAQIPKMRIKRGIFSWLQSRYRGVFNDELWDKEWYIQDYRPRPTLPVLDLNVVPCYKEGITGKGIRVAIVDDGLEKDHIDIRDNYDPEISYDFNDNDDDPTPRYDPSGSNSHGTKCGGVIAMTANNGICGVGIAYEAKLGARRSLDGPPTDVLESSSLGYKIELVDVLSNSWGPTDNGMTMEGPGTLLKKILEKAVTEGRNGKGIIIIFAAGNGKLYGDNCGADGYVNSIYTVPIASASQEGKTVYYSERCSAVMATAYSSGGVRNERVVTTDLNNTCTLRHSGTSAAAPLAAGIAALALQANPELTWRDFQHLIASTSEVAALGANPGWTLNGAGYWVSPNFGFGLLNAHKLITMARKFRSVPQKYICEIRVKLRGDSRLEKGSEVMIRVYTTGCKDMNNELKYLEHVELIANVSYSRRGSLSIKLVSPSGTVSSMLEERPLDKATIGLRNWRMTTVHCWGEYPTGIWSILVKAKDDTSDKEPEEYDYFEMDSGKGEIHSIKMILHGTRRRPQHYKDGPRKYEPFYLKQYYLRNPTTYQ